MARRTDSHVISDLALNRVMQICGECGWACETVHKDYGEDLLIQTHYKGIVDHYRIWIQVKGTRNIKRFYSKDQGYSIMIPVQQMLKWVRSKEIIVVILWDVENDLGLWAMPQDFIDDWNIYTTEGKKVRLNFQDTAVFDKEQAVEISWRARIDHYTDLIDQAAQAEREYLKIPAGKRDPEKKSRIPLLVSDLLRMLGILKGDFLEKESVEFYHNQLKELSESMPKEEAEALAVCLVILKELYRVSPKGASPVSLIAACHALIQFCLRHGNCAHLHVYNADVWRS
jgi:hypothetical protein